MGRVDAEEWVVEGGRTGLAPRRDGMRRSLAKSVSWRIVGTLDTFVLSFLVLTFVAPLFGVHPISHAATARTSSLIAVTELVTKVVLYFLHERGWAQIAWGLRHDGPRRRELHRRSVAKTASWRVLAGIDTVVLALIFTGSIGAALSIGGFEVVTKLVLYFLHERVWARLDWGQQGGRDGGHEGAG